MRKRSKYKPKRVMLDAVGYVTAGLQPVSAAKSEITLLGIKNHGAIEAIRTGNATLEQVNFLVNALNVANALACMGQGQDWITEIEAAQQAVRAASERPKFLFTGAELSAINMAIVVHDAQMTDPGTTVQMLEKAVAGLKMLSAQGKSTKINFKGPI